MRYAGVHVASRRVALRGSSRTVFREGSGLRPGDIEHTDREQNLIGDEHVPDYVSRHIIGTVDVCPRAASRHAVFWRIQSATRSIRDVVSCLECGHAGPSDSTDTNATLPLGCSLKYGAPES